MQLTVVVPRIGNVSPDAGEHATVTGLWPLVASGVGKGDHEARGALMVPWATFSSHDSNGASGAAVVAAEGVGVAEFDCCNPLQK